MKLASAIIVSVVALIVSTIFVSWIANLYKLTQCDFDQSKSWKCEIVHTLGIIPIASPISVWAGVDE